MMKLIIQVPCYNEAQTLEIALNHLPKHIDGIDEIEYLIINDGSRDDTVKVAKNWGVNYVVNFRTNRGLAKGFMAGLDACLRNGADIIVNTDADDQYCGDDIEKLVRPILEEKADIVIGERPIDDTEHFSPLKKKLQHFGSWTVRVASKSAKNGKAAAGENAPAAVPPATMPVLELRCESVETTAFLDRSLPELLEFSRRVDDHKG